ncbi:hypothetical protein BDV39DRAFT_168409 [Aspergillus sergii]|uniref:Uncharacterized protein n=1 Tax=Aspergillus sergii TaxID=1034303 RepID=A0A5N6XHW1_9EURO|nr:hypothetical protein BDV39DRAFT_168409 [Aspergillus sergii]
MGKTQWGLLIGKKLPIGRSRQDSHTTRSSLWTSNHHRWFAGTPSGPMVVSPSQGMDLCLKTTPIRIWASISPDPYIPPSGDAHRFHPPCQR